MSHKFTFTVEVELTREQGKFASRDAMAEALIAEIEGADPGGLYGIGDYGDSDYTVDSFEVQEDNSDAIINKLRKRVKDLEKEITRITKA